jgi:hypothetical protein
MMATYDNPVVAWRLSHAIAHGRCGTMDRRVLSRLSLLTWFDGVLMGGLADGRILALSCE